MSLLTNILSYWKLDEASGNASDSVGSNTLTNVNTVGYAPGLINNGADFGTSNTNKTLSRSGLIGTDGPRSISIWARMRTEIGSGQQAFFGFATESTSLELLYEFNGGTRRMRFLRQRNANPLVDIFTNITIGTSVLSHFVCTYDGSEMILYVNGSASAPVAASGNGTGNWSPGGGFVAVGSSVDANTGVAVSHSSTLIDEVGVWSRALTAAEVTTLYNGGAGLSYPFSQSNSRFFALM